MSDPEQSGQNRVIQDIINSKGTPAPAGTLLMPGEKALCYFVPADAQTEKDVIAAEITLVEGTNGQHGPIYDWKVTYGDGTKGIFLKHFIADPARLSLRAVTIEPDDSCLRHQGVSLMPIGFNGTYQILFYAI